MSFVFAIIENSPFASETASVLYCINDFDFRDCIIIKYHLPLIVCEKLNWEVNKISAE
jgi:hypothetical protein